MREGLVKSCQEANLEWKDKVRSEKDNMEFLSQFLGFLFMPESPRWLLSKVFFFSSKRKIATLQLQTNLFYRRVYNLLQNDFLDNKLAKLSHKAILLSLHVYYLTPKPFFQMLAPFNQVFFTLLWTTRYIITCFLFHFFKICIRFCSLDKEGIY